MFYANISAMLKLPTFENHHQKFDLLISHSIIHGNISLDLSDLRIKASASSFYLQSFGHLLCRPTL